MDYLFFILISVGIILVPGPNVLVIISTSLSHGKVRGIQTVAGTSMAMVIQLFIAAIGTSWLVASLATGFYILKWVGVAYLLYLGVSHLAKVFTNAPAQTISATGSFYRGFWVSLTNPKTIIFFSAFLPQFVVASESYLTQISLLSSIFLGLVIILDTGYALAAAKLGTAIRSKLLTRIQNGFSGLLYMGAGATLAVTKYGH